jgi:hypothetical protein
MVSKQMAARTYFPDQIRTRSRKFPDQEKRRAHGVAIEQIEKPRRDSRVGAIIERERECLGGRRMPYCGTEQLRRGANRSPRCAHRSRRCTNSDRPRVQFVSTSDFRTPTPAIPAAAFAGGGLVSDNRVNQVLTNVRAAICRGRSIWRMFEISKSNA